MTDGYENGDRDEALSPFSCMAAARFPGTSQHQSFYSSRRAWIFLVSFRISPLA